MADGYGFGGEGDWKTSALLHVLKTMSQGRDGGTSFMEDYTYHFGPGEPKILGAHMLEVCPTITDEVPSCEIHPLGSATARTRCGWSSRRPPRPASSSASATSATASDSPRTRWSSSAPDEPLPNLRWRGRCGSRRPISPPSAESWLLAGAPHHTVLSTAVGMEALTDFATMAETELVVIDADTTSRRFADELRWSSAYYRLAQRI
jgi:L-arabinose isomerase